jgi:hypothetical protein
LSLRPVRRKGSVQEKAGTDPGIGGALKKAVYYRAAARRKNWSQASIL